MNPNFRFCKTDFCDCQATCQIFEGEKPNIVIAKNRMPTDNSQTKKELNSNAQSIEIQLFFITAPNHAEAEMHCWRSVA